MILSIIDKLNEIIEPLRSFIVDNHNSPILWTGIVIAGLCVFAFTYNTLHRD